MGCCLLERGEVNLGSYRLVWRDRWRGFRDTSTPEPRLLIRSGRTPRGQGTFIRFIETAQSFTIMFLLKRLEKVHMWCKWQLLKPVSRDTNQVIRRDLRRQNENCTAITYMGLIAFLRTCFKINYLNGIRSTLDSENSHLIKKCVISIFIRSFRD